MFFFHGDTMYDFHLSSWRAIIGKEGWEEMEMGNFKCHHSGLSQLHGNGSFYWRRRG